MCKKYFCILVSIWMLTVVASAQHFVYDADAKVFFDNREYHTPFDSSQTILGTRLSPEFGLSVRDSLQGTHRFMVGVQYVQPMNGSFRESVWMPTIYYHYQNRGWSFLMGSFPEKYRMRPLPAMLLDDSLAYFNPNVRGALLRYQGMYGFVEASCDWFSMKTRQHPNEGFRLLLDGEFSYDCFFLGGHVASTHFTQPIPGHRRIRVSDNLVLYPYVGVNVSKYTPLDSFQIQLGGIYTFSRDRFEKQMMPGYAATAELYVAKTFFRHHAVGLRNTFFWSENFMPMYYRLDANLYRGNPHYRAKMYNCTELFADVLKFDFVNVRFAWLFHYVYGWQLGHQQMITVDFHLGELSKVKKYNNR